MKDQYRYAINRCTKKRMTKLRSAAWLSRDKEEYLVSRTVEAAVLTRSIRLVENIFPGYSGLKT
jgi:hypothetical protein